MVGLPPGECSGRATCAATTMLHPGSASCKLPTDPCEVVLSGSAKSTLSADNVALLRFVMHFIYLMTMQVYLILFVLAAVAALADHSSNAVLEDPVASKSSGASLMNHFVNPFENPFVNPFASPF